MEVNWEGAGKVAGQLDIWRVENKRTASGTPDFGINAWPKEMYGEFFQGRLVTSSTTWRRREGRNVLSVVVPV